MSTKDIIARAEDAADRKIEQAIVEQLSETITPARFELWFSDHQNIRSTPSSKTPYCISVFADNAFSLQRLQNTFGKEIRSTVDRVCGPHFAVEFRVRNSQPSRLNESLEQTGSTTEVPTATDEGPQQKYLFDGVQVDHSQRRRKSTRATSRAPQPGLSSFWFGTENRFAEAGVQQILEQPGQFSPFYVYGPTGSGKSHLLTAIVNDYRRRLKLKRSVLLSAEQFTTYFVNSLRGGEGLPVFRRKYRDLDLLVIDDIQFLAGKKATLGEFHYTLEHLIRNGKQVVVAADRPPVELEFLSGDLGARLAGGLTCPLRYPEFDGRVKIAKTLCARRNIKFSSKVVELVCEKLTGDVRKISGALNRLHALSLSLGTGITVETAEAELCQLFSLNTGGHTSMLSIEQAVCEFCDVRASDLKSPSRKQKVSTARMLAMYLSRKYTTSAFSEIGDYYGGRSHSTVIAAQRKVRNWLEQNEGIRLPRAVYPAQEAIKRIESNLRIG